MADYMKLNDGTVIKIEDGAGLDDIRHVATDEQDGVFVAGKITPANVSHLEFYVNIENPEDVETSEPAGIYDDLTVLSSHFDVPNMVVLISLREKTDVEKRLDAIEAEQEEQNEAIDFLAME